MSATSLFAITDHGSPTYAQIFGPVFWGFCVALVLCGVSILQGYLYFTRYNDKIGVRLVAAIMITLDLISMVLICQSMYYYMLPHYGSFAPLGAVTKELTVECLISAVITFTSQMYFVYQLHMVKSPRAGSTATVMKALVVLFATIGLAGATGCVVMMFTFPHNVFMHRNMAFGILAGVAKGFGAAADIVATVALCIFLKEAKTGISKTSSLLRSLMHLVINRGILVTLAQFLLLITFFASSGHLYWLAVHINTTKLYVCTFFGMLNARTTLQERYAAGSAHMSMSLSNGDSATLNSRRMTGAGLAAYFKNTVAGAGGIVMDENSKVIEKSSSDTEYAVSLGEIRVTTSSTVVDM
ncbi:hypothetical protein MIND_01254900 [Mycena indigotica]|uniref:DUF6534 domain-containing protein n=1 Tax=Mycena indigotica TaxID=2126181 RepID=A0A8H6S1V1_9AGAR|nr:uncharacterized protein MIND_01254900 [Mycena indigotica]KAF7291118.1 hypothetical protein MIND_01254900 [Mycena indigotica]